MGRAKVKLGERYRDEITGFEGIATARYEFLHGCVRYTLEGEAKDGTAKGEELVFDEQRLVKVKGAQRPAPTARSGGARTPAPRTGQR